MSRFLLLGFALWTAAVCMGDQAADDALIAHYNGGQLVKTFEVEVVETGGKPIAGVSVTPWALRSSGTIGAV